MAFTLWRCSRYITNQFVVQCDWLRFHPSRTLIKTLHFLLQGPSTNMIRCRKDGNWTGSLRLCPNLSGQCSLPQNLSLAIHLNCKSGHGIGAQYCLKVTSVSCIVWIYETMTQRIPVCAGQQETSVRCRAEMPAAAWFSCPATQHDWKTTGGTLPKSRCVPKPYHVWVGSLYITVANVFVFKVVVSVSKFSYIFGPR